MSECPTCGRTLRGEVCPYCGEELVDDEAVESTPVTGEAFVEAYHCSHQWQAEFIMSLLESEGIPAFRKPSTSLDDLEYQTHETTSGISIQVGEEDLERAQAVIETAKHDLEDEDN